MAIEIDIATAGDGHNMAGAGVVIIKQPQTVKRLDFRAYFGPVSPYTAEVAALMLALAAVTPKQRQLGTTVHTVSVAAHDLINVRRLPLNFEPFASILSNFKSISVQATNGPLAADARRLARLSLNDKLYHCDGQSDA